MCLRPLPKPLELRRCFPYRELFSMLHQHFHERLSVAGHVIRIGAAFEQMHRIRISLALTRPHFRAVKQ